jgi:tetratricopeptide (TPR) repeat protein
MRSLCAGRIRVAAVLVAVGLAVALSSAPSPARADDETTEQARQHYAKGKQAFDLGKWDDAIAEFEEAYKLRSDPTFLFNMAQAYRRKGDLQRALDLYKNYLIENPDSPKRSEIEKRIRALEKEMKNPARRQIEAPAPVASPSEPPPAAPVVVAPAPAAAPPFGGFGTDSLPHLAPRASPAPVAAPAPPGEVAQPALSPAVLAPAEPATLAPYAAPAVAPAASIAEAAPPIAAPEPASSGRGLRVAGIVCGAAGLASIGTAVYFYTRAASLSDKISSSDAPTSSDYQAGKDAETMQWVFYGVGAAALATGAVLYWLGSSSSASAQTATVVAPMVGPGIAGLSAQGTF